MVKSIRFTILLWLANAVGIAVYLTLASRAWIEPEIAYVLGASAGDFLLWGTTALPVLILFVLLHFWVGGC